MKLLFFDQGSHPVGFEQTNFVGVVSRHDFVLLKLRLSIPKFSIKTVNQSFFVRKFFPYKICFSRLDHLFLLFEVYLAAGKFSSGAKVRITGALNDFRTLLATFLVQILNFLQCRIFLSQLRVLHLLVRNLFRIQVLERFEARNYDSRPLLVACEVPKHF